MRYEVLKYLKNVFLIFTISTLLHTAERIKVLMFFKTTACLDFGGDLIAIPLSKVVNIFVYTASSEL